MFGVHEFTKNQKEILYIVRGFVILALYPTVDTNTKFISK